MSLVYRYCFSSNCKQKGMKAVMSEDFHYIIYDSLTEERVSLWYCEKKYMCVCMIYVTFSILCTQVAFAKCFMCGNRSVWFSDTNVNDTIPAI